MDYEDARYSVLFIFVLLPLS